MTNNISLKFNLDVNNGSGSPECHEKVISDSLVQPSLQTDALHLVTCWPTHDMIDRN